MSTWHVWGDYVHTRPEHVGSAQLIAGQEHAAERTAQASGFDFKTRARNGFEPWAAAFRCEEDGGAEFAFACYPIIRGWKRV